jgi:hypothetical protein
MQSLLGARGKCGRHFGGCNLSPVSQPGASDGFAVLLIVASSLILHVVGRRGDMAQPQVARIITAGHNQCSQCTAWYNSEHELCEHMRRTHRVFGAKQSDSQPSDTAPDCSTLPGRGQRARAEDDRAFERCDDSDRVNLRWQSEFKMGTQVNPEKRTNCSTAYSAWLGKSVVLVVLIRRCEVPVPCRIVGESVADVRVRIEPGWEMGVQKELILSVKEDGVAGNWNHRTPNCDGLAASHQA